MSELSRRGWPARLGITLLNVIVPGLGLQRLGEGRRALGFYAACGLLYVTVVAIWSTTEDISFQRYAASLAGFLLGLVALVLLPIWWTWRDSGRFAQQQPIYARWYAIIGVIIVSCLADLPVTIAKNHYRSFYIPSEAMEPTLIKNDKLVAWMRAPRDLHRGDLLLVKAPSGATYIKRLAGLPGDRIALRNGVLFVNGIAATMIAQGTRAVSYPYVEATRAIVFVERLPGETGSHLIQDLGSSAEDDVTETVVAPDHLYLLGDNRDDSADSRVSAADGGLEQVPIGNVLGRPLFLYWPASKMGQSLKR